jgi:hypothetical protein
MSLRNTLAPAGAAALTRARNEQLGRQLGPSLSTRSSRRQRLARHLHRCGERPMFEALLAVEAGQPLDMVLEDFARLQPEVYEAVGADLLPIDVLTVVERAGDA